MTTLTVYPDPSPESTTVDGYIATSSGAWATARNATSGSATDNAASDGSNTQHSLFSAVYYLGRFFSLFDTSSIPDTDTIDSAVYSVYYTSAGNDVDSTGYEAVETSPASNTALVGADFDNFTNTSGGSINHGVTTNTYGDITLDATGRGWISKTGVTKLGMIGKRDLDNSAPTGLNRQSFNHADTSGTSTDPKLTVEHTASGTTSTFYPDPNPETTTVDGFTGRINNSESWSSIHDSTGQTAGAASSVGSIAGYRRSTSSSSLWRNNFRSFYLFDTSSITDTDTVDSATMELYITAHREQIEGSIDFYVVDMNPDSNTTLANADYLNYGTTKQSSLLEGSTFTTNAYNAWTLNATGEASISLTGVTKFGLMADKDITDTEPSGGSVGDGEDCTGNFAEETGTSKDPKLVVIHSAGGGGAAFKPRVIMF